MLKAGIAGATGYTGLELVKLIQRHPELAIGWLTSENSAGKRFSDVHNAPWDYPLITLAEAMQRADEVDVVFLCLPHAASIGPVHAFSKTGVTVVDLSADYRLRDVNIYERWYGVEHTAIDLLNNFVYGLCEVYREELRGAKYIASPGCYPTGVNLGLYPLAKSDWLEQRVIVDAKSGISGAGRKANLQYNFVEAHDNLTPYNMGHRHRHIAEMEQVLNRTAQADGDLHFTFSPHLLPVNRGILSTIYVTVKEGVTEEMIRTAFAKTYAGEPFIQLLPPDQVATLRHVTHSNRCAISVDVDNPTDPDCRDYIIVTTLDNLLKGASGQALQSFNIAAGLDESMGLR